MIKKTHVLCILGLAVILVVTLALFALNLQGGGRGRDLLVPSSGEVMGDTGRTFPRSAEGDDPIQNDGAGARDPALTPEDVEPGLRVQYRGGYPASGLLVQGVWAGDGEGRFEGRYTGLGHRPHLTQLSQAGKLLLDFDMGTLRGVAVAYSQSSAAVIPVAELSDAGTITIPEAVAQSFRLVLPGVANEPAPETFQFYVRSRGSQFYGSIWRGDVPLPLKFFSDHHLASNRPLEDSHVFVMAPLEFSEPGAILSVQLPKVLCSIGFIECPFGWGVVLDDHNRSFTPGGEEVVLRPLPTPIRTFSVWLPNGRQASAPVTIRFGMGRYGPDGKWYATAESLLRTRPSSANPETLEFTISPYAEDRAGKIIATFSDDSIVETEVFQRIPERVEIPFQ